MVRPGRPKMSPMKRIRIITIVAFGRQFPVAGCQKKQKRFAADERRSTQILRIWLLRLGADEAQHLFANPSGEGPDDAPVKQESAPGAGAKSLDACLGGEAGLAG